MSDDYTPFDNAGNKYGENFTVGKFVASGTRKIAELPKHETCIDPEHEPPKMMVYTDGIWLHTCPKCGATKNFIVRNPTL